MSIEGHDNQHVPSEPSTEAYRAGNYSLDPELIVRRDELVVKRKSEIQEALLKRMHDIRAILDWRSGKGDAVLLDTVGDVMLGERAGIRRDVLAHGKLSDIFTEIGKELGIRTDSGGTDVGAIGMSAIDTVLEGMLNRRSGADRN